MATLSIVYAPRSNIEEWRVSVQAFLTQGNVDVSRYLQSNYIRQVAFVRTEYEAGYSSEPG